MMYEYSLHSKTWGLIAFFERHYVVGEYCRQLYDAEDLYHSALKRVAYNATCIADERSTEDLWKKQDRVSVKLNREVNKALCLYAVQCDPEHIKKMTTFPRFENGVDEVLADIQFIVQERKRNGVSLSFEVDKRLIALRDSISKQCKITL